MAEIAEGYSINATIVLNAYTANSVIGEIKQPKVNLYDGSTLASASIILDATDTTRFLGEIRRTNLGNQGFTIKAAVTLNDIDVSFNVADISHGRCIITDVTHTTNALLELDNSDVTLYIGELKRSNSGNQGFTIKSSLSLDDKDDVYYFADISHSKCIIRSDEGDVLASLTIDEKNLEDILGDFYRANKGQQGFTLSSKVILDRHDTNEILADVFRKNIDMEKVKKLIEL